MTDAPSDYDAVNIDVRGVELMIDDDDHEWHSHHWNGHHHDNDHNVIDNDNSILINTTPHIYNLLDLSNGLNVLIASAYVTATHIKEIRLILGPDNSIAVNGITYPLTIPSGEESGLKIKFRHSLHHGTPYNLLLDFDANKSVVQEGNGTYKLKPVIRVIEQSVHGSISGKVTPHGTLAVVTASSLQGSYSSYVNHEGNFKIMGLPAGTYTVTFYPGALPPVTLNGIVVTTGHSTDIGMVTL
jgi:hypothetical protein